VTDLSYPIGRFTESPDRSVEARRRRIGDIAALPALLEEAIEGLGDAELDTPYRPGGWTVRQVVHHLADSHMNAYVRVRLVLTEDQPTVKPYDQSLWAGIVDARTAPVGPSLQILRGLHARWVALLESLPDEAFDRSANHPEVGRVTLHWFVDQYAWHCRHHVAHIRGLRERSGW